MTQSLLAKLDELEKTVVELAKALEHSRFESKTAKNHIEAMAKENEQLRRKLQLAQGQINQMLNQWFPELELTQENEIGSA